MDEAAALSLLADRLGVGDDAATVDGLVLTTDMLHERTDFPDGTSRYTAGWRAVGASLSDIAAMGADAVAAVAVYAAPSFEAGELTDFVDGATDVCETVDAEYVGGDLDGHEEFTVATTALGRADEPVGRSGASAGEGVYVTGTLGRTAAALELFDRGETDRANDLFRFEPRVAAGRALSSMATAMMDSSDGLARSLHQLAAASDCGFAIERPLPLDGTVREVATDPEESGLFVGEDFELVFTADPDAMADVGLPVEATRLGTVVESGVTLDGDPLADRGYSH